MAAWNDEEDSDSSPPPTITKQKKFDDEEEDEDVIESWDADDSEVERENVKKAEAAKKAADEAAANKKSKTERIAERQALNAAQKRAEAEAALASQNLDPAALRDAQRRLELEADLANAGDLLGDVAIGSQSTTTRRTVNRSIIRQKLENGEEVNIDLTELELFQPKKKEDLDELKEKLVPVFLGMQKMGHYPLFLQEFYRECAKNLSSEQVKKLGSALTMLSNEKLKEEKAADTKGKKPSKAKAKATVQLGGAAAGKGVSADTTNYDEAADYDDFM